MWEFTANQTVFDIGEVKIGGTPGERPTVLIGSIFYSGHSIVTDSNKGEFNREEAEALIRRQEEYSDKTGNPHMIDVVASSPEAMRRSLDFVAGVTGAPLLLGGVAYNIRLAGLTYVKESGLRNEIVYNSLMPEHKKEEIEEIKQADVKSAVLLAYNIREFTVAGRLKTTESLVQVAEQAGIRKPLVDTCVIDIPSLGDACKAIYSVKNRFGLPSGCGAHNAIGTWRGLKTKMGRQATHPSIAAACAMTVAAGADFILYGPIGSAEYVFPAVAMADAAYAQLAIRRGVKLERDHPRFRIA